jgi:CDP-glucose 4,6-dehydratase
MLEFYKGKTVLVTGHTGFKGSWLCEILINAGAKVVGYSLEPPTEPSLFNLLKLEDRMVSVIGDVRDFDHLNGTVKKYKPEIVFHLAAQPIVLIGYQKPAYTYHVNVMGTVNILEAIRKVGCVKSFLNVTTDKVYENNDLQNHPFKEDEKLDGFDPYSNSKSCSELVTHAYKKSFFADGKTAISTARAGNVIGGGDFSPDRIIPDCVRAVEAHKPIEVRNRFSTRPYQFVLEPLFVYLLIAKAQYEDGSKAGYYNVGPDPVDFIATGDLVSLFCRKWGHGISFEDKTLANAPHEAAFLSLDNSLLKKTFGWSPVYHIDETMDQIVEWTKVYLDHKDVTPIVDKQINEFAKRFGK